MVSLLRRCLSVSLLRLRLLRLRLCLVALLVALTGTGTLRVEGASNLTLPNSPTLQQSTSGSGSAGIILLPDRSFIACSGAELYKSVSGVSIRFYTGAALDGCRALAIDRSRVYLYVTGAQFVYRITMAAPANDAVKMNTNSFDSVGGATANLVGLSIDGVDTLYVWNNDLTNAANNHPWQLSAGASGIPGAFTKTPSDRSSTTPVEAIIVDFVNGAPARWIAFTENAAATNDASGLSLLSITSQVVYANLGSSLVAGQPIRALSQLVAAADSFVIYLARDTWVQSMEFSFASVGARPDVTAEFESQPLFTQPILSMSNVAGEAATGGYTSLLVVDGSNAVSCWLPRSMPVAIESTYTVASANSLNIPIVLKGEIFASVTVDLTLDTAIGQISPTQLTLTPGQTAAYITYTPPTTATMASTAQATIALTIKSQPSGQFFEASKGQIYVRSNQDYSDALGGGMNRLDRFNTNDQLASYTNISYHPAGGAYIAGGNKIDLYSIDGSITPMCTPGANGAIVGFVTSSDYLYAIDASHVYRCPSTGGVLTLYSSGGAALATPLRGIAISEQVPPVLFVNAGDNIQALMTVTGAETAPVSPPIVAESERQFQTPYEVQVNPTGDLLFVTAYGNSLAPFFGFDSLKRRLYRIYLTPTSTLTGFANSARVVEYFLSLTGVAASGGFVTNFIDVEHISLDWASSTYGNSWLYFTTSNGVLMRIAAEGSIDVDYTRRSEQDSRKIIAMAARPKSRLILTRDQWTHAEVRSTRDAGAYLYFTSTFGSTYPGLPLSIQLYNDGSVLGSPVSGRVSCGLLEVTPSQFTFAPGSTGIFEFTVTPTEEGSITCTFGDLQTVESARFTYFPQNWFSVYPLPSVGIDYPSSFRSNVSTSLFWERSPLIGLSAWLVVSCPGSTVSPARVSMIDDAGVVNITGGAVGPGAVCTATVEGEDAKHFNPIAPSNGAIPITAPQRIAVSVSSGPSSPIVVPVESTFRVGLTAPAGSGQLSLISMSIACEANGDLKTRLVQATSTPVLAVGVEATAVFSIGYLGRLGNAMCTITLMPGGADLGLYYPIDPIYFRVVPKTLIAVSGIPTASLSAGTTSFDIVVPTPLSAPGQLIVGLTCASSGVIGAAATPHILGAGMELTGSGAAFSGANGEVLTFTVSVPTPDDTHGVNVKCTYATLFGTSADQYKFSSTGFTAYLGGVSPLFATPSASTAYVGSDAVLVSVGMAAGDVTVIDSDVTVAVYCGASLAAAQAATTAYASVTLTPSAPTGSYSFKPTAATGNTYCLYKLLGTDASHFSAPAMSTFVTDSSQQLVARDVPVTGTNTAGSTTQATVFTIALVKPTLAAGEVITVALSCVNPYGSDSYVVSAVDSSFTSSSVGDGSFGVTIPAVVVGAGFHVKCSWSRTNARFLSPPPVQFWVGTPVQLKPTAMTSQLTVGEEIALTFTTDIAATIAVATSNLAHTPAMHLMEREAVANRMHTMTATSKGINVFATCQDRCGADVPTVTLESSMIGYSGSFPAASSSSGPIYVVGSQVGSVECRFQVWGVDAPHFLPPQPITLRVTPEAVTPIVTPTPFNLTFSGGLAPLTVTPSVYTPGLVARGSGVFTATMQAPGVVYDVYLGCSSPSSTITVSSSGGNSIMFPGRISWLSTTTAAGVWTIQVPDDIDGTPVSCSWIAYVQPSSLWQPAPFTFFVAGSRTPSPVQMTVSVPSTASVIAPYQKSDFITLKAPLTTPLKYGFRVQLTCAHSLGAGVRVFVGASSWYNSAPFLFPIGSLPSIGFRLFAETAGAVTCTLAPLEVQTEEFQKFIIPTTTINIAINNEQNQFVYTGDSVSAAGQVNIPFGTPSTTVTLTMKNALTASEFVGGRLSCWRTNALLTVSPPDFRLTSLVRSVSFTITMPTVRELPSETITCYATDITSTKFHTDEDDDSGQMAFSYGDAISFAWMPLPDTIYVTRENEIKPAVYDLTLSMVGDAFGGEFYILADCGVGRSTLSFLDSGNWIYGLSTNSIRVRLATGPLLGPNTCTIQVSRQWGLATLAPPPPLQFNLVPRETIVVTGVPTTVAVGQSATITLRPSIAPGPNGIGVVVESVSGWTITSTPALYWPDGNDDPQDVAVVASSSVLPVDQSFLLFRLWSVTGLNVFAYSNLTLHKAIGVTIPIETVVSAPAAACTGVVTATATIAAERPNVNLQLTCDIDFTGESTYSADEGNRIYFSSSALTGSVQLSNMPVGSFWCRWVIQGVDAAYYSADRFRMTFGSVVLSTISVSGPAVAAAGSPVLLSVVIPVSPPSASPLTVTMAAQADVTAVVSEVRFTDHSPTTQNITLYTPTTPTTLTLDFSVTGPTYLYTAIEPLTLLVVAPVDLIAAPPTQTTYTGTPLPIAMTLTAAPLIAYTLTAACTNGVVLTAPTLTFPISTTASQSFLVRPSANMTYDTNNLITCSFTLGGAGASLVNPVSPVHFTIIVPYVSSTGSAHSGGDDSASAGPIITSTGGGGGNNNSTQFCATCSAAQAAIPAIALYIAIAIGTRVAQIN